MNEIYSVRVLLTGNCHIRAMENPSTAKTLKNTMLYTR